MAVPLGVDLVQRAVDRVLQKFEQVRFEPHQDGLRLRVAEAAVEFERARVALRVDHHAGVEKPAVWQAVGRHPVHRGKDDLAHDARVNFRCDDWRRRIRAHAAGIGAEVAVVQALVVLRRREREHVRAVRHDDEARLFADEALLDDDARTGVAQPVADEHGVDRGVRLVHHRRDDDTFARGQPVRLHHDRRAARVDVGMRGGRIGKRLIRRRRDAVASHERLGEVLGTFEPRGGLRWAEDLQSCRAERIDDSFRERRFRTDDGQQHALRAREGNQLGDAGECDISHARLARGAGVAGRDEHLADALRLRQLPRQRVLAPATADDEYVHDPTAGRPCP